MLDLVGRVPDPGDSVEVDGSASPRSTSGVGASGGSGSRRPAARDDDAEADGRRSDTADTSHNGN